MNNAVVVSGISPDALASVSSAFGSDLVAWGSFSLGVLVGCFVALAFVIGIRH